MKTYLTLMVTLTCAILLSACASRAIPTSPAPVSTRAAEETAIPPPSPTSAPLLVPSLPFITAPTPTVTPPAALPVGPTLTATPALVTIQFSYNVIPSQQAVVEALIARFNQTHSNIQVVGTNQETAGTMMSTRNRPDVAMIYPSEIAALVRSDVLTPLDSYLQDGKLGFGVEDVQDILPAFVDRYPQFGQAVYSVAFMRSMEVMYYNADLLRSAGLNKPPETWDEFAKVCAAVSKPPDTFCYEIKADASDFVTWVYGRGGDMLSVDGRTVAFHQKPGLEALTFLNELFRKKYGFLGSRAFQEPSDFAAGKVAFTFDSTLGLGFYERAVKATGKNIQWGIAPFPRTTAKPVVNLYGPSLVVSKTTPDKQRAAFAFVKWLMDREPSAEWVKATGHFPARLSTKAVLGDFVKANPLYAAAYEWLPYGRQEPNVTAWHSIRGVLAEAVVAVANGKATPEDALKQAAQKANDLLAAP